MWELFYIVLCLIFHFWKLQDKWQLILSKVCETINELNQRFLRVYKIWSAWIESQHFKGNVTADCLLSTRDIERELIIYCYSIDIDTFEHGYLYRWNVTTYTNIFKPKNNKNHYRFRCIIAYSPVMFNLRIFLPELCSFLSLSVLNKIHSKAVT